MSDFRFWLKTDVRIGPGSSLELINYIKENNCINVALIVDQGVKENSQVKKILQKFKGQIEYLDVSEADYEFLEHFRKRFGGKIDLFVAIGGGSAIDVTKAMSVLLVNKKLAIEYNVPTIGEVAD